MKLISQELKGKLIVDGYSKAFVLGETSESSLITLHFALYTMGPEHHVLPSFLLDDWGNEITGLKLYRWIRESGTRFPRAEVFGVDPMGNEVQYFLRDIELFSRYPTYAVDPIDETNSPGVLLDAILVIAEGVPQPRRIDPPADIEPPLREARVHWWQVSELPANLDFLNAGARKSD